MVRMFLVTANVGSVFDNLEHGLPVWLHHISSAIASKDPEFVAIHFQETGGKSCDDASDSIKIFLRQLVGRMEELNFRMVEAFIDSTSNLEDQFTALSSIFFVHESHRQPVYIWDFQDAKFVEVTRFKTPPQTEFHPNIHMGSGLNETHRKQKEKFPLHFYLNHKWSRKGFLRTRWLFGKTIVDLINIHLFHDSCNLTATNAFPSSFAQQRGKALSYTLDRVLLDGLENSSIFIFGDFNFRVNAHEVMEILKKDFGEPVTDVYDEQSLVLGTKMFHCPQHEQRFKDAYEWLKPYDFEAKQYPGILYEHDLNFHPTYPFEEDMNEPEKYMRTRLPAWCDRVLFTSSSRDAMAQDNAIEYNLIGSNVCMGDHKPVGLFFNLQTEEFPKTMNSRNNKDAGNTSTIPNNDSSSKVIKAPLTSPCIAFKTNRMKVISYDFGNKVHSCRNAACDARFTTLNSLDIASITVATSSSGRDCDSNNSDHPLGSSHLNFIATKEKTHLKKQDTFFNNSENAFDCCFNENNTEKGVCWTTVSVDQNTTSNLFPSIPVHANCNAANDNDMNVNNLHNCNGPHTQILTAAGSNKVSRLPCNLREYAMSQNSISKCHMKETISRRGTFDCSCCSKKCVVL